MQALNTFLNPDRLNLIAYFGIVILYAGPLYWCTKRWSLNAQLLNLSLDAWICMLYSFYWILDAKMQR